MYTDTQKCVVWLKKLGDTKCMSILAGKQYMSFELFQGLFQFLQISWGVLHQLGETTYQI